MDGGVVNAKRGYRQASHKIGKVMDEFKAGTLRSSSGDLVTDVKQAKAIALSEAGLSKDDKDSKRHERREKRMTGKDPD